MEIRVYLINIENYEFDTSPINWDDEKFMSEAEIQGGVYSLSGFQEAFNSEYVNTSTDIIRIIGVPYDTSDDDLINQASILIGDSHVYNPEYTRGICELIACTHGIDNMDTEERSNQILEQLKLK